MSSISLLFSASLFSVILTGESFTGESLIGDSLTRFVDWREVGTGFLAGDGIVLPTLTGCDVERIVEFP